MNDAVTATPAHDHDALLYAAWDEADEFRRRALDGLGTEGASNDAAISLLYEIRALTCAVLQATR